MENKKQDFKAKVGQIDYTNIQRAPVINCLVKYNGKILIVQRNSSMKFYPDHWNGISGFLDDKKTIEQKVNEELREEIGIEENDIITIKKGEVFEQDEPRYNKTWIVHPVLVEINTNKIKLDWEAQNFKWIEPGEIKDFKLVPGFGRVLEILLGLE